MKARSKRNVLGLLLALALSPDPAQAAERRTRGSSLSQSSTSVSGPTEGKTGAGERAMEGYVQGVGEEAEGGEAPGEEVQAVEHGSDSEEGSPGFLEYDAHTFTAPSSAAQAPIQPQQNPQPYAQGRPYVTDEDTDMERFSAVRSFSQSLPADEIYMYLDESGAITFTNLYARIPARYKAVARKVPLFEKIP